MTNILKRSLDIITHGKDTVLNKPGSPYQTKGGMGDTLTGICGALLSRGADTLSAASAGAYINGLAGEIAVRKYGESAITTDLIDSIHEAIKTSGRL